MGVQLGKGDGEPEEGPAVRDAELPTLHDRGYPEVRPERPLARTTPPPAPYRPRPPAAVPVRRDPAHQDEEPWHRLPTPVVRALSMAWPALWIAMFATAHWRVGLVLLFLTGPFMALLHGGHAGRERRRREVHRRQRERSRELRQGSAAATPVEPVAAGSSTSAAERSLAATLVRVESSPGRFDAESLGLVHEVEGLLRPLLAHVRTRSADAQVRHDLETLATEHLPRTVDDFLVLPADYAREHRTSTGTTPADELRSQLHLLVAGCRQLRDSVHDADVDRQQQQSRFLEAKFRRSDLDL